MENMERIPSPGLQAVPLWSLQTGKGFPTGWREEAGAQVEGAPATADRAATLVTGGADSGQEDRELSMRKAPRAHGPLQGLMVIRKQVQDPTFDQRGLLKISDFWAKLLN